MAPNNPFFPLIFILIAAAPAYGKSGAGKASSEFIRTSCNATRYPRLCVASLSSYADSVRLDPVLLAQTAATVSLDQVRSAGARVAKLSRRPPADARTVAALRDCKVLLGDAADCTRQASSELRRISPDGEAAAWRVGNAQTLMSAALTDEETCTDGMDGAGPGPARDEVGRRVGKAKQYTSNALALVNRAAATA